MKKIPSVKAGQFTQQMTPVFDFDNKMPFEILREQLKSYDCAAINDSMNRELEGLIQSFKGALIHHYQVRAEERGFIVINFFTDNGATLYVKTGNIFTACLLYGRYVPAGFLYKNAVKDFVQEFEFPNGSIIRYDYSVQEYILSEPIKAEWVEAKIPKKELIDDLREYGTVVTCREENNMFYVLIENTTMNAREAFECTERINDSVGKKFPVIDKFSIHGDTFNLILKPKKK